MTEPENADLLKKTLLKNNPEKALSIVNDELFKNGEKNIPLKAFLGVLNLRSGVLTTFNANYIDPVIKSKNGNISFVKGPFIPRLGAYSDTSFIPLPLSLNAGDKLYFYSNDILEVKNSKGKKYGGERLLNVISSCGDDVKKGIDSVRKDMVDFTGENTFDADIAFAVLKYTPAASAE